MTTFDGVVRRNHAIAQGDERAWLIAKQTGPGPRRDRGNAERPKLWHENGPIAADRNCAQAKRRSANADGPAASGGVPYDPTEERDLLERGALARWLWEWTSTVSNIRRARHHFVQAGMQSAARHRPPIATIRRCAAAHRKNAASAMWHLERCAGSVTSSSATNGECFGEERSRTPGREDGRARASVQWADIDFTRRQRDEGHPIDACMRVTKIKPPRQREMRRTWP